MLGNVLIVGGAASIAPEIIDIMSSGAERVVVTFRTLRGEPAAANIRFEECDLSDPHSRSRLVSGYERAGENVDAVVLLTGAILGKNLESTTDADMVALADANLIGPAAILRDLLPVLNEGARVLIVSSVSGQRGSFDPLYAATKGALIPFAKSLATWLGSRITVTVIAPGAIEGSSMVRDMSDDRIAHHRSASPTKKLLEKSDLARIVFDLAHKHWGHSNGAVISLNGGSYV